LTPDRIRQRRRAAFFGKRVSHFSRCFDQPRGVEWGPCGRGRGALVIAERTTAGAGARVAYWHSERASGISRYRCCFGRHLAPGQATLLTMWPGLATHARFKAAGAAVRAEGAQRFADQGQETGRHPGRKCRRARAGRFVKCGHGHNVNKEKFPGRTRAIARSLRRGNRTAGIAAGVLIVCCANSRAATIDSGEARQA